MYMLDTCSIQIQISQIWASFFWPFFALFGFSIFFPPVLFSKKLDKRFVAGVLLVILLLRPTLCSSDASSVFTNFPAFGSVIFKNSAALIFPFMADFLSLGKLAINGLEFTW